MTYRDAGLERDLLRKDRDDGALSRLLRAKRGIVAFGKVSHSWTLAEDELYAYYTLKLRDIPEGGATCDCCHFIGLVNIHRVDGRTLGPECATPGHVYGSCRR